MKNEQTCPNCNNQNDFYKMNCDSCGTILRGRVVNIDFWSTTWQMIESPTQAIKSIIYSEHKNLISFIAILGGFKLFLLSSFIMNLIFPKLTFEGSILTQLFISAGLFILLQFLFAFTLKFILKPFDVNTRFKDNLAIYIYSTIPLVIALTILFPIEYGIFGGHWIYFNPSPYLINFSSALILSGVEILFLLWHLLLLTISNFVQTKNIVFSLAASVIILVIEVGLIGFVPAFIASLL